MKMLVHLYSLFLSWFKLVCTPVFAGFVPVLTGSVVLAQHAVFVSSLPLFLLRGQKIGLCYIQVSQLVMIIVDVIVENQLVLSLVSFVPVTYADFGLFHSFVTPILKS
jgi:hypothetical protein